MLKKKILKGEKKDIKKSKNIVMDLLSKKVQGILKEHADKDR